MPKNRGWGASDGLFWTFCADVLNRVDLEPCRSCTGSENQPLPSEMLSVIPSDTPADIGFHVLPLGVCHSRRASLLSAASPEPLIADLRFLSVAKSEILLPLTYET